MTEFETIKLTFDDPIPSVAKIVFSRPKAMNALNSTMISELDLAVNEIEFRRKEIRAVLLTGEGKAFIAGADIAEMAKLSAVEARHFLYSAQQTLNRLENLPMPTIALINGYALGGGLETALACDIRIASEKAVVGLPEVSLGIIPAAGGTQRLTRLVGVGMSKLMILTGRHLNAEEALANRIVTQLIPHEDLEAEVIKILKEITSQAPLAVSFAKKSIHNALDEILRVGLELELDKGVDCFLTQDLREGMNAFLEKRKPEYQGK
ncbi:MAG: enoyl-CoA hydratase/isomerase family protein [Candidatus Heimdallarchaeota archaeon]|nr:enoyl-CoA hydratase/isomerase family protein [Candidatus Heimdallarchaeota archaeon]